MSRAVDGNDHEEEGGTPAKRRKVDNNDTRFKHFVIFTLKGLADAVFGPFAVTGRLNAPMIHITIKNSKKVVNFPLYEEPAELIQLIEQSPHGKVQNIGGNSWELSSGGFEILNPAWNDFVNNELVAKITGEMFIEFPFTPLLNKLLLNKSGSFFLPYDSKQIDGTFAMVVIQLPSFYKGGKITIRNEGRTVESDYDSAESSNAFRTFYTVFYSNDLYSKHSPSMVTEGSRVCLIYNLISRTSVIPKAPQRHAVEKTLVKLLKDWKHRGKLVYALKHKYSESNLSFDNLKATDRSIANFLLYIAKETDLNVCLAILNKESNGKLTAAGFDFDSDDEDVALWKSYNLSKLIATDGTDLISTPLTVDSDAEVILENCFENINPCRRKAKQPATVTRFVSSAAVVFWPKRLLIEVPKKSGASSADLGKIFLKEIGTYRGEVQDDSVKTKLKNCAKEIISIRGNKSIDVIKAIVELRDVQLIQSLFLSGVILDEVTAPLLVDVCENYGWKTFADQVPQMFKNLTRDVGVQLLGRIRTAEMDEDKKAIVHKSVEVILKKSFFFPSMGEEQYTAEREFLLSACRLAEKFDFEFLNISRDMPILFIVPVLLHLASNNSNKLPTFWKDVAQHFIQQMEEEASKSVHNLRRDDTTNCPCRDCGPLNAFLASEKWVISFKMGKTRRVHLQERVHRMRNISCQEYLSSGVLVIQKAIQMHSKDAEKRAFSLANWAILRAILPN